MTTSWDAKIIRFKFSIEIARDHDRKKGQPFKFYEYMFLVYYKLLAHLNHSLDY